MLLFLVLLVILLCNTPLALYLSWIARLTRRERPTVVSGPWDFVGLVAGLSGYVLFGGGLILSLVDSRFRWYWLHGNFASLRDTWGQEKVTWVLTALLYLAGVVGWIALVLAARRRSLVVYNVDPAAFEATVAEVFEQLNRPVERRGNLWVGGVPLFELDRFPGGRTVTLRWVAEDHLLFQDVERLLREAVRNVPADENPATVWVTLASVVTGLFALICFGLLVFMLLHMR